MWPGALVGVILDPMAIDEDALHRALEERIAPLLAVDGGAVEVVSVDGAAGTVRVRFLASYQACPGREVLAERVLEPVLRRDVPGVERVEWVD